VHPLIEAAFLTKNIGCETSRDHRPSDGLSDAFCLWDEDAKAQKRRASQEGAWNAER